MLAPLELQPVEVIIIDPKAGDDFNYPGSYRGEDAPLGLTKAFEIFEGRKQKDLTSKNLIIVFIDEMQSLINLLPAKSKDENALTKEEAQRQLNILVSLSRSYSFSVQLATQQPSAQIFGGSAAREQFGLLACLFGENGGGGSETLSMMFDAESREAIKTFGSINGRGGFISINGGQAVPFRVPRIKDWDKLNSVISNNIMMMESDNNERIHTL